MNRLLILFVVLLSVVFNSFSQDTKPDNIKISRNKKPPRNIILILTDDHLYDYMGFTGKIPWLETPNLDLLANGGAYLPNAFVTTSLCSPSRASLLTGQYSHTHQIVDNAAPNPGNLIYFPEYLQKAGYQTSFFGKWHMGEAHDNPRPGFNHWESFKGQGEYYNPTLNINGKRITYKDSTYITDLLTKHAISWLEERDANKPFFMYLSHKAVHAEFKPAKRHRDVYKNKKTPFPSTYNQTKTGAYKTLKWPEWVANQRTSWHGVDYMYHDNYDRNEMIQKYCETLLGVDESVGAVMSYLKQEGLDKNTLVIYMGDNGFSWGEHGLIDKRHFYEESVKVPLLVHCPDLFSGGKIPKQMVQNIDVAPTILDIAGLQKPLYMPGSSFVSILKDETVKPIRDEVFYEYYWEYDFPMTPTIFGMRTADYKYIRYHGIWDRNELYNIKNDPDEMYNLIGDPAQQERIEMMANRLYDWMETTKGMNIPLKRSVRYRVGDYKYPKEY